MNMVEVFIRKLSKVFNNILLKLLTPFGIYNLIHY